MTPQEQAINGAFNARAFRLGEARKRWRLARCDGAVAIIAITCADRGDGVVEYLFRFDLTNYPSEAPTAKLWDEEKQAMLQQKLWPNGGARIAQVFNSSFPHECLYLPCDRAAIANHGERWLEQDDNKDLIWKPERGLVFYLEVVSELLTSTDYTGCGRS